MKNYRVEENGEVASLNGLPPVAFVRISDGEIFIPHPDKRKKKRWVNKIMFEEYNQDGYFGWNTKLFSLYVVDGSFEPVFFNWQIPRVANFYRLQKEFKEAKIAYEEYETGCCHYCKMPLHVCLCSHDDDDD